jgi:PAS domain S-box-containing protein
VLIAERKEFMKIQKPARILVIDDRAEDCAQICQTLRRDNYQVEAAASEAEAFARLAAQTPDLILLAGRLAELDGVEMVRSLRADPAGAQVPIIFCADINDRAKAAAFEAGADDFLNRPINVIELAARVRSLLALKFAREELAAIDRTLEERVTDRTALLEQALRGQRELLIEVEEAHALLQSTFNAMTDAVIVTDPAGRITQANGSVATLFGRAPEEVIGDYCHWLLAEGQSCPHTPSLDGEAVVERETANRARDRLLSLRVSRITDAEKQLIGFIHVIRDITRQRAMERYLMQAERMSLAGQMVSAVAHEVATPLSVVANIAEMLLLDVEPGSQTAVELQKIVTQVRRVTHMMRSLLGFVRGTPAPFASIDLAQLARETLDLMSYELRKARIEVSLEAVPATPPVWGDRSQLQQVLLNLITNARQAMKEGGRLLVRIGTAASIAEDPRAVALVVEDSGPGIEPEAMMRLFDFFFTTRSAEGGTGLGLTITKQIVEGHGGRIKAENVPGGGARFTVTLPAAFLQQQERPDSAAAVVRAAHEGNP